MLERSLAEEGPYDTSTIMFIGFVFFALLPKFMLWMSRFGSQKSQGRLEDAMLWYKGLAWFMAVFCLVMSIANLPQWTRSSDYNGEVRVVDPEPQSR